MTIALIELVVVQGGWNYSGDNTGRGHTKYIRAEDAPDVTRELENYQKFRDLTRRWVKLEIELAKFRRSKASNRQENAKKQKKAF